MREVNKEVKEAVYRLLPFTVHNGRTFSGLSLVAVSPCLMQLPSHLLSFACLPILILQPCLLYVARLHSAARPLDSIISFVPSITVHYLPISAQSQKVEQ